MEITTLDHQGHRELQLQGRLDANWADRVGQAIELAIQSGHHLVDLEFTRVDYVSSAGIRVLLKYHKQLKGVRGMLRVLRPTPGVLEVLRLSGIAGMLGAEQESRQPAPAPSAANTSGPDQPQVWEQDGFGFELHKLGPEVEMEARLHGRPEAFAEGSLGSCAGDQCRCEGDWIAVGLGDFGRLPDEGKGRFGEALAVAGSAVCMPTDGSSVPDYQITEGQLVPEMRLLYGLSARGRFSRLLRFEAGRSPGGVIGLSALVERGLEVLCIPSAAFAIVAETSGLVGSTLLRSPDQASGRSPLAFPGVRDWLSFTTERANERQIAVVVGFAERSPSPESLPFTRRIGPGTQAQGHFHAAVFPYRPLPKGRLDLAETVSSLLNTGTATTVLHLLADGREFEGVGETDLMRGACWLSPLRKFQHAPQT